MPAEVEVGHADQRAGGHDARAEQHQLHGARGRSSSAGDHVPHRQFEHRGGQQRARKQNDERCEQSGEDAGPPSRSQKQEDRRGDEEGDRYGDQRAVPARYALAHEERGPGHQPQARGEQDPRP